MPAGTYRRWMAGAPLAGLCLFIAVQGYFVSRQKSLQKTARENNGRLVQQLEENISAEQKSRQKLLVEKKLDLKEKWETALGGPVELPSKDPTLSIAAMIEATAKACGAPGTRTSLLVERFTEFTLTIELPAQVTRSEIATTAACLLRHCGPYLHRLRFLSKGEPVAELAPEALALVSDWKSIKPGNIQLLLDAPRPELRLAMATPQPSPALSQEEQKLLEAENAFHSLFAAHFGACRDMISKQDRAANLGTMFSPVELSARLKSLEDAEPRLKEAQRFFEQPEKEYEAILHKTGFDSLVVRVTTRGYVDSTRMQNSHLLFIFDKLMERQAATKKLLATLVKYPGQWTTVPDGTTISFQDPQAKEAYHSVFEEYEMATEVLDQALKSMPTKTTQE
jgi:hypothetical protein